LAYVIKDGPEIYSWLSQHTLQQHLDGPALFVALALVPDFVVGLPAVLLFGFVRCHTQKKSPTKPPENNAWDVT
jgi:hypothetical protein